MFGVTMAFALLWIIAILVPDESRASSNRHAYSTTGFGLVINGTHYILDSNVGRYSVQSNENVRVIHSASPTKRVSRSLNLLSFPNELYVVSNTSATLQNLNQVTPTSTKNAEQQSASPTKRVSATYLVPYI